MHNQKDEKLIAVDHEDALKKTIYHNAKRYLEALIGLYLTKGDVLSASRIRGMIKDLTSIYNRGDGQ
tara:strand:- start:33256 stop:33456 length:201 start_codon:yes stop_codon:yes gene_type:complete